MPGKAILIVEDEDNLRNGLAEMLQYNEYTVAAATNGQEALQVIAEGYSPDLILSDIIMPEMDGLALCHALQQDDRLGQIPFIFLSAKSDLEEIREGMNIGADDYLTKPVKFGDLVKAIELRMGKREALRQQVAGQARSAATEAEQARRDELLTQLSLLTESERRVLRELAELKISKLIAQKLYLSVKTIQNHRSHMVVKFGMKGQNTLLAFAVECRSMGLLD